MFVQAGAYCPVEGAFSGLVGTMFRVQSALVGLEHLSLLLDLSQAVILIREM